MYVIEEYRHNIFTNKWNWKRVKRVKSLDSLEDAKGVYYKLCKEAKRYYTRQRFRVIHINADEVREVVYGGI